MEGSGSFLAPAEHSETTLLPIGRQRPSAGTAVRAFGEPDATPFIPASPAMSRIVENLTAALAGGARHIQTYVAQRDYAAFAIYRGDLLIIGTPKHSRNGDLVLANFSDASEASGVTVLRQKMGDALVPPLYGRLENEETLDAGILGTVISIVRSPVFS
jgi:SOS-response transcriptional repressor LexA